MHSDQPGTQRDVSASGIQDLARAAIREFERDPRGPGIARLLGAYSLQGSDWRTYALRDPQRYARNLVATNEHFELLVLVWDAGQTSPIHNHAGQQCWMSVLEGDIEEVQYAAPTSAVPGPLVVQSTRTFVPGKVAYIDDDIALHLVRPARGGRGAVSLHLYARPFAACHVYDEHSGRVSERQLSYYSVEGRIVAPVG